MSSRKFPDPDWAIRPWFLHVEPGMDDIFQQMGFPLEARARATTALSQLFTPSVCDAIDADFTQRMDARSTGKPVKKLQPWDDAALVGKLLRYEDFEATALELQIEANLKRMGAAVQRVATSSAKTPDLDAKLGALELAIEVKRSNFSAYDEAVERLGQLLSGPSVNFGQHPRIDFVTGLHLDFQGASGIKAVLLDKAKNLDEVVGRELAVAFAECSRQIAHNPAPGTYPVPRFGQIVATPTEGASYTFSILPAYPLENRARQMARLVYQAAEQLPPDPTGIVVVDVHYPELLGPSAEAVRKRMREQRRHFAHCHLVVLMADIQREGQDYGSRPVALYIPTPNLPITVVWERFAAAIAGRHGEDAWLLVEPDPRALPEDGDHLAPDKLL